MRKFLNTVAVVLSIFMMWSCGEGATQQQSQSKVYQSAVVQAEDITVERKFSAAYLEVLVARQSLLEAQRVSAKILLPMCRAW